MSCRNGLGQFSSCNTPTNGIGSLVMASAIAQQKRNKALHRDDRPFSFKAMMWPFALGAVGIGLVWLAKRNTKQGEQVPH